MNQPTFDRAGYPTEETLLAIERWPHTDIPGLLDFLELAWHDNGRIWRMTTGTENELPEIHLATGGWSGNESIIYALQQNRIVWSMLWKASQRGGKFVLEIPKGIAP